MNIQIQSTTVNGRDYALTNAQAHRIAWAAINNTLDDLRAEAVLNRQTITVSAVRVLHRAEASERGL